MVSNLLCLSDPISHGVALPQFPSPTHSRDASTGLKPYTTIDQAFCGLTEDTPDNVKPSPTSKFPVPAYSTDQHFPRCIRTTDWPDHPEGKRASTVRKIACLQGFPIEHLFYGTKKDKQRQIGNAVPPSFGAVILNAVKASLLAIDGESSRSI